MKAKSFTLNDQTGTKRTLKDFNGSYFVLYFYPKNFTGGCTKEAQAFRDAAADFRGLGATIVGVSKDTEASHAKFIDKFELPFTLLSDPDLTVTKRYEAFGTKNMYGKVAEGVKRATFLIGPDGTIVREWRNGRVAGHVEEVLDALREAVGGSS